ncbi:MAG: SUF system Fe-S cluster assembly regulator [Planctomycetes bacterium]|nr:SUF system Fe-S cluster assembly regulator [Planctomycetota bacterium]
MIRMTRLTDYGIMLLSLFAREPMDATHSARDLAKRSRLPQPTVSKILKLLAHQGVLVAHRGVKGGFTLARKPEEVSVAEIIGALEGPIGLTECTAHPGDCTLESLCPVRSNWIRIHGAVRGALEGITLAEMARPLSRGIIELRHA